LKTNTHAKKTMLQTFEIVLKIVLKKSLQYIGSDGPSIDPQEKKKKKKQQLVTCIVLLYLSSLLNM
jgi:hypothetical protein